MAEEIDSAGVKRLILHFKKDEDNTLKLIQPVQKQEVGPTGPANPQPITAQPGDPPPRLRNRQIGYVYQESHLHWLRDRRLVL
jgi:hypothetical protein